MISMQTKILITLPLVVALGALAGCGDDDGDGGTSADAGLAVDGGDDECSTGPTVSREDFIGASVDYLRATFEREGGFTGGTVVYGEMWVPLDDGGCPVADWTALGYVVDMDPTLVPEELEASHGQVAVMWALNGRKFIVHLDTRTTPDANGAWQGGRLPDSFAAVPAEEASDEAISALVSDLATDHPELTITWLEGVRILTVDGAVGDFVGDPPLPALVPATTMAAAAADVRASGLFTSIDWSGLVFRIPNETRLVQVIDDGIDDHPPVCD
jgi:hypothetical protein